MDRLPYEILYQIFLYVDRPTLLELWHFRTFKNILDDETFWYDKFALDYPDLKGTKCLGIRPLFTGLESKPYTLMNIMFNHNFKPIKIYYKGELIGYIVIHRPILHHPFHQLLIEYVGHLVNKVDDIILLNYNYEVLKHDDIYHHLTTVMLGATSDNYISILKCMSDKKLPLPSSLEGKIKVESMFVDYNFHCYEHFLENELTHNNNEVKCDHYHDGIIELAFDKLRLSTYRHYLKYGCKCKFSMQDSLISYLNLWFERKGKHHRLKPQIDKFISMYPKNSSTSLINCTKKNKAQSIEPIMIEPESSLEYII